MAWSQCSLAVDLFHDRQRVLPDLRRAFHDR
jgi:hypothetical protein